MARAEMTERKLTYLAKVQRPLTDEQTEALLHYLLKMLAERVTVQDWEHTVDVSSRAVKRAFPVPVGAAQ